MRRAEERLTYAGGRGNLQPEKPESALVQAGEYESIGLTSEFTEKIEEKVW